MIKTTVCRLYYPQRWDKQPQARKEKFLKVQELVQSLLAKDEINYSDFESFQFKASQTIRLREKIEEVATNRRPISHSLSVEKACVNRILKAGSILLDKSLYENALSLRELLFGKTEPLRTFDVTIVYLPWLRMVPPRQSDPIFQPLKKFDDGPAIFQAIQAYLVLLTGHPFSDGNGRVSRIMFNVILRQRHGENVRHFPISELCRSAKGMYEELLARGHKNGNYLPLIDLLLDLFTQFSRFIDRRVAPQESDLQSVRRLLEKDRSAHFPTSSINETPPYLVSVRNLMEHQEATEATQLLQSLANELIAFGKIQFMFTTLRVLIDKEPSIRAVTIFMQEARKEDMIMRARELRAQHRALTNIEFVVITGDAIINAKLLVNVSNHYDRTIVRENDCTIILYDF